MTPRQQVRQYPKSTLIRAAEALYLNQATNERKWRKRLLRAAVVWFLVGLFCGLVAGRLSCSI